MNKKTIYIIVAVLVIVIVVAGAAAFLLMNGGNNGNNGATPTPSPTSTPTVVGASKLQFSVSETTSGAQVTYNFAIKNANTTTEIIRMDIPGGSAGNYSYIINIGTSTSYLKVNDGAWTTSTFSTDSAYAVAVNDYVGHLVSWNGHDATYSYTATSGSAIVISAIHVNPTLEDSLFATS